MKKAVILIIWFAFYIFAGIMPVYAHPGKTDAEGGHKDKKNISGLGAYHYHHGQSAHLHHDGKCPYEKDSKNEKIAGGTAVKND